MSDTFRQVGHDLPGGGSSVTAAMCKRNVEIMPQPVAVYEIEGERDALLAGKPDIGAVFETILDTPFYVTKCTLSDLDGGAAKLTVNTAAAYANATYGAADAVGEPQYCVRFQELRRRVEAHPCCGTIKPSVDNSKPTWENWQDLEYENWVNATGIPGWLDMGAWSLDDYTGFKKQGIDEYTLYLPIVTRTQGYTRQPEDIGKQSGRRNNPPVASYAYISNYDWLCGPDEFVQRGSKYERQTSWMACEVVLPEIYSNAR